MRKPTGYFTGELQCHLIRDKVRVLGAFSFWNGQRSYDVPKDYIYDGASIPVWCRWIPSLVLAALMGWFDWNGYHAAAVASILQALIGWPLAEEFREPSAVHDWGYETGIPKLECDVAFLQSYRLRLWYRWAAKDLSAWRAYLKTGRAFVMFTMVLLFGWPAYWQAAWKRRRVATAPGAPLR